MTTKSETGIFIFIIIFIFTLFLIYRKKWFVLNEKNLLEQKLFWISIGLPIFSFCYFGAFSWWGKTPILSAHGYARFYEISKFPLMLLASAVPLGAIVSNIHRTIQTEKQIEEARKKNISDSYYSHFKHVVDYFTSLPEKKLTLDNHYDFKFQQEFSISFPIHLYKFIYNENSPSDGVLKTNDRYMKKLSDELMKIIDELENLTPPKSVNDNSILLQAKSIFNIESSLTQLKKMMCIDIQPLDYHFEYTSDENEFYLRTNFGSAVELAGVIDIIYQFIINIYEITVYFDFHDLLREDQGHIVTRLMLLRDISPEIFEKLSIHSGAKKPTFVIEPHKRHIENNGDTLAAQP